MVNILDDLSSILRCNYMHALVMIQGLGVAPTREPCLLLNCSGGCMESSVW